MEKEDCENTEKIQENIDELVFETYGLSEQERQIVEEVNLM